MAQSNRFLTLLALLSLAVTILAIPTPDDRTTADDIHLNAVLPEKETELPAKKSETDSELVPPFPNEPVIFDAEATTKSSISPNVTTSGPANPSYFSRVITSIFEIPIAVLSAVRNLLNTAAAPQKSHS